MTIKWLQSVTRKLDLTVHELLVLYSYTRIGLNRWGTVHTLRILNKLVTKFNLKDSQFDKSYGTQLAEQGILTQAEGAFFDGQEINSFEDGADQSTVGGGPGGDSDSQAPQGEPHAGVPRKGQSRSKRGRKAKAHQAKRGKVPAVPA